MATFQELYKNLVDAQTKYDAMNDQEAAAAQAVTDAIKARKDIANKKGSAFNDLLKAKAACLESI